MRWSELVPELSIVTALDHAGPKPESESQNEKRRWSEKFANACAIAVADEARKHPELEAKRIRPESLQGGTEPLTPLGAGTKKRIDVTVVDPILGLEIGFSLKGLNFRDTRSGNFDKNLTGRLYELGDETRLVHEHLPHAYMVALFFLPLESTSDKTGQAKSSFAHAVMKLRERTGRLDPALSSHASRVDAAYVALYAAGSEPQSFPRGVARFFDVMLAPPRRGRPLVAGTLSLAEVVSDVVKKATYSSDEKWGDAEQEELG